MTILEKQLYCLLERFTCFDLDNPWERGDVIVEKYEDFQLVKQRIIELSEQWRNRLPQLIERGLCLDDSKDLSITIILHNRWNDSLQVGVSKLSRI
jgi:hypothetical protein